jgi:hypothetical protein
MSFDSKGFSAMNRFLLPFGCALALLCGCKSFEPKSHASFIDMDNNRVIIEYGQEPHKDIQPDGRVLTFNGKIRLTLPDGSHVYLLQNMSPIGVLYRSKSKDYNLFERGPYCVISHNGEKIFEGVYCDERQEPAPKKVTPVKE